MEKKNFFEVVLKQLVDTWIPKSSILYKLYLEYKSYNEYERKKIIIVFILIEIGFLLLLAKIFGITSIANGLFGGMASITYPMFIIINFIILFLLAKRRGQNGIRGIMPLTHRVIAESTEYGSAIMMNYDDEIKEKYTVSDIDNAVEQIYGQIPDTNDGTKVVSEKKLSDGTVEECNILGIGKAGTGKTSTIGIPNIFQCIKRGESYVCIDPKAAEIRQETIYVARELNGYKCYTLNVLDPDYSDGWDFLGEVVDHKNRKGRLDSTKLDMFVNVYFPNTAGVGGEQAYYVEGAAAYLKLLISVLTWRRESHFETEYKLLYKKLLKVGVESKIKIDIDQPIESLDDFKDDVKSMISTIGDISKRKVFEDIVQTIESTAPTATIDDVHYWQAHEQNIIAQVKLTPNAHPARLALKTILDTLQKVPNGWIGFKQNLATRLSMFNNEALRMSMSTPNIDLRKINKEKSAIYIVCKDGDTTFRAILSLFFAFLMMDIKEEYDIAEQKAKEEGRDCPALPVYMFLDEMYSVGAIGGLPSKKGEATFMASQISTVRSRKINMTMLFQSHSQIEEIYGEAAAHTILMNTNCKMFLGGDELDTTEYFSELLGDTTVLTESHSETQTFFTTIKSDTHNVHTVKSRLMTAEEIGHIPKRNILLVHGTDNPVILSTFYYKRHPLYRPNKRISIASDIVPITARIKNGEIPASVYHMVDDAHPYTDLLNEPEKVENKIKQMIQKIPDDLLDSDQKNVEENFVLDEAYLNQMLDTEENQKEESKDSSEPDAEKQTPDQAEEEKETAQDEEKKEQESKVEQATIFGTTEQVNIKKPKMNKSFKKKKNKNTNVERNKDDIDINI